MRSKRESIRGLKGDVKRVSGSLTHGTLQTEPSFTALGAKRSETAEGLPDRYRGGKPSPGHKITEGTPTHDETFHEPLEFGPNYQHDLAGKKHFAEGGHARGGRWIQGAINPAHAGALHKSLHVPAGKKIPFKTLEHAEHSQNPTTRKRASLAMTLRGFHHRPQGR